jgi:hypothetical protein
MVILRAIEKMQWLCWTAKNLTCYGGLCVPPISHLDEKNATRARANIHSRNISNQGKRNPFNHKEILGILDLMFSMQVVNQNVLLT